MKINSIIINNFYSIEYAKIEFDAYKGITLIDGTNKDSGGSNGSGKSVIIEAVVFALFGRTIRKSTEDDLVNNVNKKKCSVTITVNDSVVIERGKKPTYLKFTIDGEELTEDNQVNTQRRIEAHLNISYKTFLASSVFGQENNIHFISANPDDKRVIIQKFLNLSWLSTCRDNIKQKKSDCNQGIKAKQAIIDNNLAHVKKLQDSIADLSSKQVIALPYTYEELTEKWKKYEQDTKILNDLHAERKKLIKWHKEIVADLDKAKSSVCPTCAQKLLTEEVLQSLIKKENTVLADLEDVTVWIMNYDENPIVKPEHTLEVFRKIETKNASLQDVAKYQELIDSLLKDNSTKEEDKVALNRQYEVMRFWEKAFSESGLVKYIIRNILTYFNQKVNFYLSYLSNNKINIVFNDTLEEDIRVNKSNVTYTSLSGGEKRKVSLATMLGLQSLLAITNKEESDIIFFDEVAENIDDEGIEGLYILLSELKKTKKVFVITHNTQLKSLLQGNKSILVRKENGKTKISK